MQNFVYFPPPKKDLYELQSNGFILYYWKMVLKKMVFVFQQAH